MNPRNDDAQGALQKKKKQKKPKPKPNQPDAAAAAAAAPPRSSTAADDNDTDDEPADPWRGTHTFIPVWQPGDAAIAVHDAQVAPPTAATRPAPERLTLAIHTPMRLQQQGKPLRPAALTPRKLVADLLRRVSLLAEFHAGHPGLVADAPALVHHAEALAHQTVLRWQDWSRYSSRQQQEMTLGGAVGHWTLEGDLAPLLPWLWLGQWLHVGKNATMGMGGYALQP